MGYLDDNRKSIKNCISRKVANFFFFTFSVDGVLYACGKGSLRDFVPVVILLCLVRSLPHETQRDRTVTMSSQSKDLGEVP